MAHCNHVITLDPANAQAPLILAEVWRKILSPDVTVDMALVAPPLRRPDTKPHERLVAQLVRGRWRYRDESGPSVGENLQFLPDGSIRNHHGESECGWRLDDGCVCLVDETGGTIVKFNEMVIEDSGHFVLRGKRRGASPTPVLCLEECGAGIGHVLSRFTSLEDGEEFGLVQRWFGVEASNPPSLGNARLGGAEKIIVRTERDDDSSEAIATLHRQLRALGPNWLLYVRVANADHPDGDVRIVADGLLHGHVSRFAQDEADKGLDPDSWARLCSNTVQLLDCDTAIASAVAELAVKFEATWNRPELIDIEQQLSGLSALAPHQTRAPKLIGAAKRRRLDWEYASIYLMGMAARFPEDLDFPYDAALAAVDGGNYRRAQEMFRRLSQEPERLTDRQLRGVWRAAPLVAAHELAWTAFQIAQARGIAHCTPGIESRLQTARANAADPAIRAVGVLSIGENCLPAGLANRWGLRPEATLMQQDSPFNLAQTAIAGVTGLFEDGFDRLIQPDLLRIGVTEDGASRPLNDTCRFDFNHEPGEFFLADGFREHIARYSGRIACLKSYLAGRPCIYFFYAETPGDLVRLAAAVIAANAHRNFRLVIIDAWDGTRDALPEGDLIRYHRVTLPSPDYRWYTPDNWDSDAGLAFERGLQDLLIAAIREVATSN